MEQKAVEFKRINNITEEEVKEWLTENKAERFLEKEFPILEENQILIVTACANGHGSKLFIAKVEDQQWLSAYLAKGLYRVKEFYTIFIIM
jgi:hypothetical protein